MPKSFGVVFVVALMMWAVFGVLAGEALGSEITAHYLNTGRR
jgi:hypothetical protein